ncbi:MAG: glycoside hydrolase family 2 TIM barrel-domain containing protein [bacterium]
MISRLLFTGACLLVYLLLSYLSRYAGLLMWQTLLLLMPWAFLAAALGWTSPRMDLPETDDVVHSPIEDVENPSRKIMWLNGLWEFRLARARRWRRIQVPRSWNTFPGLEFHTGKATFRRLFSAPEEWSLGRVFLHFRGVNHRAEVSIDGRQVGTHDGGYTHFSFDVTERVRGSREKELEVTVANRLDRGTVPSVAGWRNEGGIIREVYLETCRRVFIRDAFVIAEPDLKGRAAAALSVKIDNPEWIPRDYRIEVHAPGGALVHSHRVESWTMQTLQHRFSINFVSLWAPGSPSLYTCRVILEGAEEDSLTIRFGVRKVECRENGILLNGKKLKLACVDRWEDFHGTGCVGSLADVERDMRLAAGAGFNAVRLTPHPHHPAALDICDRAGILVLEEIPVWKAVASDLVDPVFQQSAENQLSEMILRDRNHPCVIMWGIANDVDSDTREARWFIERLARVARGLDSRPLYIVSGEHEEEACADLADVAAVSFRSLLRAGREEMDAAVALWRKRFPHLPLIAVDFWAAGRTKPPGRIPPRYSQQAQALALLRFLKFASENRDLAGWSIASLSDRWNPGAFTAAPPFFSSEGILTHEREPKASYNAVRRFLTEGREEPLNAPPEPRRVSLPFVVFIAAALAGLFAAAREPSLLLFLAAFPERVPEIFPGTFRILLFATLFNAAGWTILIHRFFRRAPQNLIGSIDIPFFRLISAVLKAEWRLFAFCYVTIIMLWIYDVTMLDMALPGSSFTHLVKMTSAVTLPDVLFGACGVTGLPLWVALLLFHAWKLYLAFFALGAPGALIYVVLGPLAIIIVCAALLEFRFHVLKYIRKLL